MNATTGSALLTAWFIMRGNMSRVGRFAADCGCSGCAAAVRTPPTAAATVTRSSSAAAHILVVRFDHVGYTIRLLAAELDE